MDILKEITKEEHKKHSLVQNWHKEELSYFIQKLIDKALKKQLNLTDVVVPKGTLCDHKWKKHNEDDIIKYCSKCYVNG